MTSVRQPRALVERGWRYTLVGVVCALANYGVMLATDFLGGSYLLGILAGFLIVTPPGYALHVQFTFAETFSWQSFMRFTATIVAAYPLATAILVILCSGLKMSVAIAYPIAVAGMFAWNFAAAHWAILPRNRVAAAEGSQTASAKHTDGVARKESQT